MDLVRRTWGTQGVGPQLFRILSLMALTIVAAYAGIGGAPMPWDVPLANLGLGLTGKTALMITVAGVFGVVASMIWHGEFSTFAQRATYATIGGAFLMGVFSYVSNMGATGALV